MTQCIKGLKIALLMILCAGGSLRLHAQDKDTLDKKSTKSGPLFRKVNVDFEQERLETVLKDLAEKGYFTFSYQSDIVNKDRLVTLTMKESTVQEALQRILGEGFEFVGDDDYVVMRRGAMARKATRKEPMARKMPMAGKMPMYGQDSVIAQKRRTVESIISDLVADGLVRDKDSFSSFALDNGQFLVDGKPMSDSLRLKYAGKYIGPDGDGYYYGPVSVHGRGFFFDKKEIFGSPR
jgi:hypothetical protein